ncbi:MAG TPA: hypothetical protein VFE50_13350 [Cyclobacteriaceae bacterium]|nr:hypothetical protein [Cyclobacteriaceae bacterium]
MKVLALLFLLPLCTSNVLSQKLYVWCPNDPEVVARKGLLENEEVNLVIFDGRLLTKNSKIECSDEETVRIIGEFVKKAYPSSKINLIETSEYFKDAISGRITIKVAVAAYHAAFGADLSIGIGSIGEKLTWGVIPEGKWNAATGYYVQIYDYRNEENKLKSVREITRLASKSNLGGYTTAKKILNQTYLEANQDLLFFIDNTFMK